ncbi:SpoIIE family protein phosphatase [Streptomyces sp. NPDC007088]|uniref:SpoIIE family protein phosphatase n=1 Tax=Streptomyces sp. NPDC007088 TaxID=3364773 RepID=UPI003681D88E
MATVTESSDDDSAVVLVVDDSADNRYLVGTWLRRAGHTVLEAADGQEGLALLADPAHGVEAAVVDVRLPDMSGLDVCEAIRSAPATEGLPVLQISASAVAAADRTQGLRRGADAYLTEPIEPDELVATLHAVLRYARARARAEGLAERLALLNTFTLDLYRASSAEELALVAARAATRLLGAPSSVVLQTPRGRDVQAVADEAGARPSPAPTGLLDVVAGQALADLAGGQAFLTRSEGLLPGFAGRDAVVMTQVKAGRAPVCLAVPAQALRSVDDRHVLAQLVHGCALALEAQRSFDQEHTLALTLQRSFLPASLPREAGMEMAVRYRPASAHAEIGGDFYEALATPEGMLLAIGDIAGHSLDAAMVMGQLRHALRAYALENHPPHIVLERLDHLLRTLQPAMTATLCLVLVAPDRSSVQVANAGHLPPLLRAEDGTTRYVREHGTLLGVGVPQPPATTVAVEPGTSLLLFTDGLVERRGEDLYSSMETLRTAFAGAPEPAEDICAELLDALPADDGDDIALLAVRLD